MKTNVIVNQSPKFPSWTQCAASRMEKIITDLFRKPTDRNQNLLPDSSHLKTTTRAIPKKLGLRIVRICAEPESRDKRLEEIKQLLLQRGYEEKTVVLALNKAALKRRIRSYQERRPVFSTTFDPRLISITRRNIGTQ